MISLVEDTFSDSRSIKEAKRMVGKAENSSGRSMNSVTVNIKIAKAKDKASPISSTQAGTGSTAWPIWHFDFYRFNDPQEWEDAGFRDIFAGPGLKLVEWPDKAGRHLPAADLRLCLETIQGDGDAQERRVSLHALTPTGAALTAA